MLRIPWPENRSEDEEDESVSTGSIITENRASSKKSGSEESVENITLVSRGSDESGLSEVTSMAYGGGKDEVTSI